MKTEIVGKNIEVTPAIKERIEEMLQVVDKYFHKENVKAHVVVRTYPVGQKIVINLSLDANHRIKQEVINEDLYVAIDIAGGKLERQIRKFKDRLVTKHHEKKTLIDYLKEHEETGDKAPQIIKRKHIDNKPMSEEEAILQFEISGYNFYLFEDQKDETTKVLYRRKDGEYGILVVE